MKQTKTRVLGAVLLAAVVVVLVFATGVSASDAGEQGQGAVSTQPESRLNPIGPVENAPLDVNAIITANCRYGLTGAEPYASWLATQNVGLGWYIDFSSHQAMNWVPGAEYAQQIRVLQDRDSNGNYLQTYSASQPATAGALGSLVSANPGSLWIVGNEPCTMLDFTGMTRYAQPA